MEDKKRRALNFKADEVEVLLSGVEGRKQALFGKFSQNLTAREKDEKWTEIADAITSVFGVHRSVEAVKKKWVTMSSQAKLKGARHTQEMRKTGGGEADSSPLTDIETRILGVIGKIHVEGEIN